MKKNNNKFKNNNSNMYNLNYRFDSLSPAGKCCGTALDLIKRYNELAKEAGSAGNYVEMEVFRQYAEHYRKIVTEINERKSQFLPQAKPEAEPVPDAEEKPSDASSEDLPQENNVNNEENQPVDVLTQKPMSLKRKTLKIVEVKASDIPLEGENPKKKRTTKRKTKEGESPDSVAAV